MRKFLFLILLVAFPTMVFADGYLDAGLGSSKVPYLQKLSPKVSKTVKVALSGNVYQYIDVTDIKQIRIVGGVTATGAYSPLEIYFYSTATSNNLTKPFLVREPQDFGIAAGVTRVYYRNYSTASPPTATAYILAR